VDPAAKVVVKGEPSLALLSVAEAIVVVVLVVVVVVVVGAAELTIKLDGLPSSRIWSSCWSPTRGSLVLVVVVLGAVLVCGGLIGVI